MPARTLPPSLAAPQAYISRPVHVVAMQWRGDNYLALREFLVHHLGSGVQVTIHGDAVHFTPREHLIAQVALNDVIMFVRDDKPPRFRVVTEREFNATFRMLTP